MSRSRGHVLSGQQVKLSTSAVSLADQFKCAPRQTQVHLETDPVTGDVIEIHITCACGEHIVLDCHYDGEFAVREP